MGTSQFFDLFISSVASAQDSLRSCLNFPSKKEDDDLWDLQFALLITCERYNKAQGRVFKFNSVANFKNTFKEPEYFNGLMTLDGAVFSHNDLVMSEILQSEEEGSDDGVSFSSTADSTGDAAPTSYVDSNNR